MKRQKGPDIRDLKPTMVIFDSKLTIDGGSLSSSEIGRIWMAIRQAFEKEAHGCGLGWSFTAELSCVSPKRMLARIARSKLCVEYPRPASAVVGKSTTQDPPS